MLFNRILYSYLCYFVLTTGLGAESLKESVLEVLNTNPIVQERLKNFRAIQQDLNIAESEYLPKLDLRATAGYNNAGELYDHVRDVEYTNYETSVTLTQNIFDGFGTMHKVDYQESRILAAAYNYIEKADDVAFQMVSVYINVLRSHELLLIATENVKINETIFEKVKVLYDSGLTTDSEVKKIQSALSLAKSNLTVQKNNTRDAEYSFRRVLGRMPELSSMQKPSLNIAMPQSIERAALYAVEHNPSLLVSRYNIKGAEALWEQRYKEYYPKLDLEVSQSFNDAHEDNNGFDQPDDRFKARLVLTYNLFRGGADMAEVQKNVSQINQEIEIKRDLQRQVVEGLDLSWNAYEMIALQLQDLHEYKSYSDTTLSLYQEEYDLGRRSLLDLLASQNDVINAKTQIVSAEYELLFSKYRILDAMGLLVQAVAGDESQYAQKVNLNIAYDAQEVLDTLPVNLDRDGDNIMDNIDLCDNSLPQNNIMPYGCEKIFKDSDADGISDTKDKCPFTPKDIAVSPDGCAVDSDNDGVADYLDQCADTPYTHTVNDRGCSVNLLLLINYSSDSASIPKESLGEIEEFAAFLKKNSGYKALIIGHTNNIGDENYNLQLSKKRAVSIKDALVSMGISNERIQTQGKGESEPLMNNDTAEGLKVNRRVAIELTQE